MTEGEKGLMPKHGQLVRLTASPSLVSVRQTDKVEDKGIKHFIRQLMFFVDQDTNEQGVRSWGSIDVRSAVTCLLSNTHQSTPCLLCALALRNCAQRVLYSWPGQMQRLQLLSKCIQTNKVGKHKMRASLMRRNAHPTWEI